MSRLTHALVLTAGLGTRLRPLTLVRAKPAIPVAGIPMARRILQWLASAGVTDAVLNLHHPELHGQIAIGALQRKGPIADLDQLRYWWHRRAR